ncbi:MAG: IS1-like element transposase [Cyclobacteriaceae bacterium]
MEKYGRSKSGQQKCRCKGCNACFQLSYSYNASKEGIEEQVWEMSLNGSGTRDIGRVLPISKDTVTAILNLKRRAVQGAPPSG